MELGLAICKHLVELFDGSIRADSEGPGRGTTLKVELPLMGHKTPSSFFPEGPETFADSNWKKKRARPLALDRGKTLHAPPYINFPHAVALSMGTQTSGIELSSHRFSMFDVSESNGVLSPKQTVIPFSRPSEPRLRDSKQFGRGRYQEAAGKAIRKPKNDANIPTKPIVSSLANTIDRLCVLNF